jgi:hypothetical protein
MESKGTHDKPCEMDDMPSISICMVNRDVYEGSQSLGRAKMKDHWRNASAPLRALIAYLMRLFCANYIRTHGKGFNWSISRLVNDRLAVSAECLIKWYALTLIFAYIVFCESSKHL